MIIPDYATERSVTISNQPKAIPHIVIYDQAYIYKNYEIGTIEHSVVSDAIPKL